MRTKEKTEPIADRAFAELLDALADAYLHPREGDLTDRNGNTRIPVLQERFQLSALKIRRLLVTAEVFAPVSEAKEKQMRQIRQLADAGKTIPEIVEAVHMCETAVKSYIPYKKGTCKIRIDCRREEEEPDSAPEESIAEELPERKEALERLQKALKQYQDELERTGSDTVDKKFYQRLDDCLWSVLSVFAGYPFCTATGLAFTYTIRGYEMFVDRKDKSITKSTVAMAFHQGLKLQYGPQGAGCVSGPKKLGTFGASYLYPVFIRLGIIRNRPVSG